MYKFYILFMYPRKHDKHREKFFKFFLKKHLTSTLSECIMQT